MKKFILAFWVKFKKTVSALWNLVTDLFVPLLGILCIVAEFVPYLPLKYLKYLKIAEEWAMAAGRTLKAVKDELGE